MKFDHFRQIVGRIRQDVPCPRCGALFDDRVIEVVSADVRTIEFFAPCDQCGAVSSIFAQIEPVRRVHQSVRPIKAPTPQKISPELVRDISEAVRTFQKGDVKELFQ
ncbi:hypothetical protein K9L63_01415 [Candidatus Gracilibacteria bacterium]|nr:hypothetical protein [Candidatus Gracilibacteria bacterium]